MFLVLEALGGWVERTLKYGKIAVTCEAVHLHTFAKESLDKDSVRAVKWVKLVSCDGSHRRSLLIFILLHNDQECDKLRN